MKTTLYTLILAWLIFSCGQSNSKSISRLSDITQTKPLDTNKVQKSNAKTDSIDIANNKSVLASGDNITKAYVYLNDKDSTIRLTANIRKDHRIFGYSEPNIKSERLLLLSIFTNDVKDNPFGCKLGAYYDTSGMENLTLKYNSVIGNFVKAIATDHLNKSTTLYFEKKWIDLNNSN